MWILVFSSPFFHPSFKHQHVQLFKDIYAPTFILYIEKILKFKMESQWGDVQRLISADISILHGQMSQVESFTYYKTWNQYHHLVASYNVFYMLADNSGTIRPNQWTVTQFLLLFTHMYLLWPQTRLCLFGVIMISLQRSSCEEDVLYMTGVTCFYIVRAFPCHAAGYLT